jgi:hypothetical protein
MATAGEGIRAGEPGETGADDEAGCRRFGRCCGALDRPRGCGRCLVVAVVDEGCRSRIEPGDQPPAVGAAEPDRDCQRRSRAVDFDALKPATGKR